MKIIGLLTLVCVTVASAVHGSALQDIAYELQDANLREELRESRARHEARLATMREAMFPRPERVTVDLTVEAEPRPQTVYWPSREAYEESLRGIPAIGVPECEAHDRCPPDGFLDK